MVFNQICRGSNLILSSAIQPFNMAEKEIPTSWRSIAIFIVDRASDKEGVLNKLYSSFFPMSWSGSRANIMQNNLPLLEQFFDHQNSIVSEWAKSKYLDYRERIKIEIEREEKESNERYESFE